MLARPLLLLACTVTLTGCGGDGAPQAERPSRSAAAASPSPGPAETDGYPSSMAIIGHSGATGVASDPERPEQEVRENSWATGTNPQVQSVYSRILEKNPAIEGRATNLAEGGATVDQLADQAARAVALDPKPELVLVQFADNDIVCPPAAEDLRSFQTGYSSVLQTLAEGAPEAEIFVVSMFGSPTDYVKALDPVGRQAVGGEGECDVFDSGGKLNKKGVALLEATSDDYEAELEKGCDKVDRCTYDAGALGEIVDKRAHIAEDFRHLSVRGHAEAAKVTWKALRRAGIVNR